MSAEDQEIMTTVKFFGDVREYTVKVSLKELLQILRTGKLDTKILTSVQVYDCTDEELGSCQLIYSFDSSRKGDSPWQLLS